MIFSLLTVALQILDQVLSATMHSGIPKEVIADLTAGIALLQKVKDNPVTKDNLESLRLTQQW